MAPWSRFWEHNFFAGRVPALEPLLSNLFVRGGVSGIGAITAIAGIAELATLLGPRRRGAQPPGPGPRRRGAQPPGPGPTANPQR